MLLHLLTSILKQGEGLWDSTYIVQEVFFIPVLAPISSLVHTHTSPTSILLCWPAAVMSCDVM